MTMLRDPGRIDPIIEKLRELWKTYPDQRLTQLITNYLGDLAHVMASSTKRMRSLPNTLPGQSRSDITTMPSKKRLDGLLGIRVEGGLFVVDDVDYLIPPEKPSVVETVRERAKRILAEMPEELKEVCDELSKSGTD